MILRCLALALGGILLAGCAGGAPYYSSAQRDQLIDGVVKLGAAKVEAAAHRKLVERLRVEEPAATETAKAVAAAADEALREMLAEVLPEPTEEPDSPFGKILAAIVQGAIGLGLGALRRGA